ncbi:hypothetical protein M231_04484 [Tremella mesenterica]|uniref:BED-type domain-containing protein n=1 Tax=Tremella mesenterica TaxID=5217 RepID=A0A4Q1BKL6_TREME|nr:hypothetical protein M231_04484 [Tremella mesenterica]
MSHPPGQPQESAWTYYQQPYYSQPSFTLPHMYHPQPQHFPQISHQAGQTPSHSRHPSFQGLPGGFLGHPHKSFVHPGQGQHSLGFTPHQNDLYESHHPSHPHHPHALQNPHQTHHSHFHQGELNQFSSNPLAPSGTSQPTELPDVGSIHFDQNSPEPTELSDGDADYLSRPSRPSKKGTKGKSKPARARGKKTKSSKSVKTTIKPPVLASISTNLPSRPRLNDKNKSSSSQTKLTSTSENNEPDLISQGDDTALLLVSPSRPPLSLRGYRGALLPAPPNSQLEVCGLLILHPPTLDKHVEREPLNQYTLTPKRTRGLSTSLSVSDFGSNKRLETNGTLEDDMGKGGENGEMMMGMGEWKSQYEMYTCRLCAKTYDGRNARSVARRHLQDKHGLPLSMQGRRSRWDQAVDRPKDAEEARERALKSKRGWAMKHRIQIRLEQQHSDFLSMFGPLGLCLPNGVRLIAPHLKETQHVRGKWLDGTGRVAVDIPAELLEGARVLSGAALPSGQSSTFDDQLQQETQNGSALVGTSQQGSRSGMEAQLGDMQMEEGWEADADLEQLQEWQASLGAEQWETLMSTVPDETLSLPSISQSHFSHSQSRNDVSQGQLHIDPALRSPIKEKTNPAQTSTSTSPASSINEPPRMEQQWVRSSGWTPATKLNSSTSQTLASHSTHSPLISLTPLQSLPFYPSSDKNRKDHFDHDDQGQKSDHRKTPSRQKSYRSTDPLEAVAETLLDLHSTPLRSESNSGDTGHRFSSLSISRSLARTLHTAPTSDEISRTLHPISSSHNLRTTPSTGENDSQGHTRSTSGWGLMAAAEITDKPSRVKPIRSKSLLHPYQRARAESVTTGMISADDPFIDRRRSNVSPGESPSTHLAKRRKTISASQSGSSILPTNPSKHSFSGSKDGSLLGRVLQPLKPSVETPAKSFSLGASAFAFDAGSSHSTRKGFPSFGEDLNSSMKMNHHSFGFGMNGTSNGEKMMTPLRQVQKENIHPPSSDPVAKWLRSSPGSPEKDWKVTPMRTPGLGMMTPGLVKMRQGLKSTPLRTEASVLSEEKESSLDEENEGSLGMERDDGEMTRMKVVEAE